MTTQQAIDGNAVENLERFGRGYEEPDYPTIRFLNGRYFLDDAERLEIKHDCRFVADVSALRWGWVRRVYDIPVKSIMGCVADRFTPPAREELGDMDEAEWFENAGKPQDPWHFTISIIVWNEADAEGDRYFLLFDDPMEFECPPIPRGLGALVSVYAAHLRAGCSELPVIELACDSNLPRINVVGWHDEAAALAAVHAANIARYAEQERAARIPATLPKKRVRRLPKKAAKRNGKK